MERLPARNSRVKDFYDTAGIRTTAAFEHFKKRVPQNDASAVAILKAAGAIVIGKTNMHTLGMGTTGIQSHFLVQQEIPGTETTSPAAHQVARRRPLRVASVTPRSIPTRSVPAGCRSLVAELSASWAATD
jgi:aspartyl-tRNA(Asn)/glutamyl-tRNA(Gln) amidotransferase subunit A